MLIIRKATWVDFADRLQKIYGQIDYRQHSKAGHLNVLQTKPENSYIFVLTTKQVIFVKSYGY
jgi:hypothetical protein